MRHCAQRIRRIFVLTLVSISFATPALAQAPSDIFIFGNSLSDTGNILDRTFGFFPPAPPYFDGRFSNGPVWVEYLAADLNLSVMANGSNPAVIEGNNFAFGGAEAANDVPIFPFGDIPSVRSQVELFVAAAGTVPGEALYLVLGGGNDVRFAASPSSGLTPEQQQQVVQDAVDALTFGVSILALAGAADFLVPNLPDLGATPEAVVLGITAESTLLSLQFNAALSEAMDIAATDLGVSITQYDTFALLEAIVDDAVNNAGGLYGITNIDTPIAPGLPGDPREGPAADNPDTALWSDDIHPSTAAHAVFAGQAFAALTASPADLNGDGEVGSADLAVLLAAWGPCAGCPADLDGDGVVGPTDLATLLASWG